MKIREMTGVAVSFESLKVIALLDPFRHLDMRFWKT
jgi:hypothetical protein